jgi:hypothetical protein
MDWCDEATRDDWGHRATTGSQRRAGQKGRGRRAKKEREEKSGLPDLNRPDSDLQSDA